jgi:hypothetical protein
MVMRAFIDRLTRPRACRPGFPTVKSANHRAGGTALEPGARPSGSETNCFQQFIGHRDLFQTGPRPGG